MNSESDRFRICNLLVQGRLSIDLHPALVLQEE